jgi:hypothetical protein
MVRWLWYPVYDWVVKQKGCELSMKIELTAKSFSAVARWPNSESHPPAREKSGSDRRCYT